MNDKEIIYQFLKEHRLAVIATVNGQALPEAAAVGFFITSGFEIYIATFDSSRKIANIKRNPRVALVVGWEHGRTVQLEGEAVTVEDPEEIKAIGREVLERIPTVVKYIKPERAVYLKIRPVWLKYSDLSTEPWYRTELKFI